MPRYATYDDYFKRTQQQPVQEPQESPQTSTIDDYYKLARDQEYKVLLDKEVALENAKSNAMKYTRNSINAQGFGGTGYGSSLGAGIYNNYMNRAMEAQQGYNENIANLNLQEKQDLEAKANDRFESITTMFQDPSATQEDMNKVLIDYGYMNENGEWNAKPENMSDDDWYQLQYYYRMRQNDFKAQEEEEIHDNPKSKLDELGVISYTAFTDPQTMKDSGSRIENGNVKDVSDEIDILFGEYTAGRKDGDVAELINGNNGNKKVYLIFYNGAWFRTDKSVADKAENKGTFKAGKIVNTKGSFVKR